MATAIITLPTVFPHYIAIQQAAIILHWVQMLCIIIIQVFAIRQRAHIRSLKTPEIITRVLVFTRWKLQRALTIIQQLVMKRVIVMIMVITMFFAALIQM